MSRVTSAGLAGLGLAAIVVLMDQIAKAWILSGSGISPGEVLHLVGPLALTLVRNDGISFGFLQDHADLTRWGLALFSLGVSAFLAVWVARAGQVLPAIAGGSILGGAVGNLIDRVRLGSVVDFIDVRDLAFPWIFNIADAAINLGVALWLLTLVLEGRSKSPNAQ